MPRLSAFIRDNLERVLSEWEAFARALPSGDTMDIAALRDHAKEMLTVVAADLDRAQTRSQQADKAQGRSDADGHRAPTAAQEHGAGRAGSGFTVEQMVSEFRALRASVLRLWSLEQGQASAADLQDMTRFNEAIDQAIAESITAYTSEVKQSKDRFLAILGHDLRTPLGAIITSTRFMLDTGELTGVHLTLVNQVERSARRMNWLVGDLLEYTRTRFGDALPAARAEMDLDRAIRDVAAEVAASYPESDIQVRSSGNLRGHWDRERLMQALINLVSNAVQHGSPTAPIVIDANDAGAEVVVTVQNHGSAIPAERLDHLFDAVKEIGADPGRDRRHLGLGLYIVERIVAAHHGSIAVESSADAGTTFSIRLPRDDKR